MGIATTCHFCFFSASQIFSVSCPGRYLGPNPQSVMLAQTAVKLPSGWALISASQIPAVGLQVPQAVSKILRLAVPLWCSHPSLALHDPALACLKMASWLMAPGSVSSEGSWAICPPPAYLGFSRCSPFSQVTASPLSLPCLEPPCSLTYPICLANSQEILTPLHPCIPSASRLSPGPSFLCVPRFPTFNLSLSTVCIADYLRHKE